MKPCKLLSILIFVLSALAAHGQKLLDEIAADPGKAGGIYYAYTYDNPVRTPAPEGYIPFYISHYGRHGSRWLGSENDYSGIMSIFDAALAAGALTPKGKDVYDRVRQVYEDGVDRAGALTSLGTEQHREIAGRMYGSFPEVFGGDAVVNAESTIIVRCIISMAAFCERLKELNPALRISREANRRTTRYLEFFYGPVGSDNPMNTPDLWYIDFLHNGEWAEPAWKMLGEGVDAERITSLLFTDMSFGENLDRLKLARGLYNFAASIQNVGLDVSFDDIITPEQMYWFAVYDNYRYYVTRGPSSLNRGFPLYYAKSLLGQIIERADLAVAGGGTAADLRFGHDINLMPLIALMQFEGCTAVGSEDPEEITEEWPAYKLSPMGANLQMIFFRGERPEDVLVKFLYNEHEMRIPLAGAPAPYYRWNDVRAFYLDVMNAIDDPAA